MTNASPLMIGEIMLYPNANELKSINYYKSFSNYSMKLTNNNNQRRSREQRAPLDIIHRILNIIYTPRLRPEHEQLQIIYHQRRDLQEPHPRARETLQDDVCEEEVGGGREILSEDGRDIIRIRH